MQQAVGPGWAELLKAKILEHEARNWKMRIVKNAKLEEYAKWKTKPGLEPYLKHENVHQRRLWTKLRGGCLELRVETGRWERVLVGGKHVPKPRYLRRCKPCYEEDSHHVLFRCRAYKHERAAMTVKMKHRRRRKW